MNPPNPLRALWKTPGPWIGDGPMGTELLRMGWSPGEHGPSHLWNRTHPDLVRAVHSQWAAIGAQLHRTNTFTLLPSLAFGSKVEQADAGELVARGIELARDAAPGGLVVVALGPVAPNVYPPTCPVSPGLSEALSRADGILLETWSHPHVVEWSQWIRPNPEFPLILSGCFRSGTNLARNPKGLSPEPAGDGGLIQGGPIMGSFMETLGGHSPEIWADWADRAKADMIGFNCGWEWTQEMLEELIERFGRIWPGPLWCFPGPGILPGLKWKIWERYMLGGCCDVRVADLVKIQRMASLKCSTKS